MPRWGLILPLKRRARDGRNEGANIKPVVQRVEGSQPQSKPDRAGNVEASIASTNNPSRR